MHLNLHTPSTIFGIIMRHTDVSRSITVRVKNDDPVKKGLGQVVCTRMEQITGSGSGFPVSEGKKGQ